MIQFLLNHQLRSESRLDPNLTVLQYLRERLHRTGSKEGCGSGDCGACTVVLAEPDGAGGLHYRSINACLTLMAALHGRQLITIEGLGDSQHLHPAQQLLADLHGSQCGFCTPGIVMSMFALQKNSPGAGREQVRRALGGNLCRCTGYRPIMDAALALCRQPDDDDFRARENQTIQTLQQIARQRPQHLGDGQHQCLIPTSIDELAKLYLQHPDARLVEGATDLALEITQRHQPQRTLIHLGQLAALRYIRQGSDSIEIGATTPLSDCEAALSAEWPQFGALLQRFASLQVRNQASLAGNIANASPIGDTPPVLIALGAELLLRRGNVQRWMKVEDFLLGYHQTAQRAGEFILTIRIPRCRPGQWLHVSKVSKRPDDDISSLCAAFCIELAGERVQLVRLAFGGMAATAARARRAEAALLGQRWQRASIERAAAALAEDFQPISDLRGSAAWRLQVAGNLLRRCFIEQQQPELACRVSDHV